MNTSIDALAAAFSGRTIRDAVDMAPYLTDWRRAYRGAARAVVQPDTVKDVVRIVRWCAVHGVPIVPQGGNSGLSGGATPDAGGDAILLSLRRMARIREVDPIGNLMVVEAGCTLAKVRAAAAATGRLFPLGLASEGTCTVGGNLATNAGGTATLRHGNARALCLGLEVVTASGEIWDGLRRLRKDNSGYDLRDLFIGSEGTLGIITGAVLALSPMPVERGVAWVGLCDADDALALLDRARHGLDAALTAFEYVEGAALEMVLDHIPGSRRPVEKAECYALIEASGGPGVVERLVDTVESNNAVVSASQAQAKSLWNLRESISEAQARAGRGIKHDIALPIAEIPLFLAETASALEAAVPGARRIVFGHLGDGNLHYNLSAPMGVEADAFVAAEQARVNRIVYDRVVARGGTVSAEHGLGQLRAEEAARHRPAVETAMMRAIKQALDPQGIMNPGKLLPR